MKRRSFMLGTAALGACGLNALGKDSASNQWSTWRGPRRDGSVSNSAWPTDLSTNHLSEMWSHPLGDSYSGPILSGNLVFTTESVKGNEAAYAFDIQSGTQVWKYEWKGAHAVPFFAMRNGSWIRATPVADDSHVYIGGIRDVLIALDVKSGQEKWRIDFAEKSGKVPDFGMVCSPIIDGEFLYIQAGKGLHKIRCGSGEIVWSSLGDSGDIMSSGAFSSPIIAELNGVRQLIVQTRVFMAGINLETGETYWKYDVKTFRGMNILTPTVWKNTLFTSSYGGRSLLLDVVDNRTPTVRWENKNEGYMSSPIVLGDYLYMHLKNKRFACLDLQSGKEKWVTKPFGEYWSMITNGDRILALDQTGMLRLIANNPSEYTLVSERPLTSDDEEAWGHLGIGDKQLFVRSQSKLTAYRWA